MMKIECLKNREMDVAAVSSDEKVIVDVQSALELMMTVQYETGASRIVLDKIWSARTSSSSAPAWPGRSSRNSSTTG